MVVLPGQTPPPIADSALYDLDRGCAASASNLVKPPLGNSRQRQVVQTDQNGKKTIQSQVFAGAQRADRRGLPPSSGLQAMVHPYIKLAKPTTNETVDLATTNPDVL